jgi:2-isopropylmalate synthase
MLRKERVYLYDTTLRDGAQTPGVVFTTQNKQDITHKLDALGIDYIEGGWPGANPTDTEFFANLPKLKNSKMVAFGMTSRHSLKIAEDESLNNIIKTGIKFITIVGKSWDFHVKSALRISNEQNLKMIADSVKYLVSKKIEVIFDAEHFFDGYKANKTYALACAKAAFDNGARWVALCDTNGGTLPFEIEEIVRETAKEIPGNHLSIHCHNDTGNAVANSLMAVKAGVRHIQGTLNGLGERCGNANLISLIPTLVLKMGFNTGLSQKSLKNLTHTSHYLNDLLNNISDQYAPFVGSSAFAHKGGLHASALSKNSKSYEHIDPELVGNKRQILVSNQSGRANIVAKLKEAKIKFTEKDGNIKTLISEIKKRESEGYSYDMADASFAIMAYHHLKIVPSFFTLESYKLIVEKRINAKGKLVTVSEAIVKIIIGDKRIVRVAEGNGPVNALDNALRHAIIDSYPTINTTRLTDYKVRILNTKDGTNALIRVLIETSDNKGNRWVSIGVSTDIISASFEALDDAITYRLLTSKAKAKNA